MSALATPASLSSSLGSLWLRDCLYRSRRTELWSASTVSDADASDLVVKRPAAAAGVGPRAMLAHEARLLGRLRSEYVLELLGVSSGDEGTEALVFRRLATALDRVERPLPASEVSRYARHIARALRALHAAGIIHRDLRPANILLRSRLGEEDQAVVADLDHALDLSASADLTSTGSVLAFEPTPEPASEPPALVVGAPGYIAPELYRGRAATPSSDVYALGVTLFVLATGERPFAHPDPSVERRRARSESALPISSYARHTSLPPPLLAVIEAALTPEPNRRPSVEQFLRAAEERP